MTPQGSTAPAIRKTGTPHPTQITDDLYASAVEVLDDWLTGDGRIIRLGDRRRALSPDKAIAAPEKSPRVARWREPEREGRLMSGSDAARHARAGGLIGLRPGSHGLAVLDLDHGDPAALLARHPPLDVARTRAGLHLIYAAPEGEVGNDQWAGHGAGGEMRGTNGYCCVYSPAQWTSALRRLADGAHAPFPRELAVRTRPAAPSRRPGRRGTKGSVSVEEARAALARISPDIGYDDWLHVGMGLHDAFHGGGSGLKLWRDWSAAGDKHESGDCETRWGGFAPGGGITWGTVAALAREGDAPQEAGETSTSGGAEKPKGALRLVANELADLMPANERARHVYDPARGWFSAPSDSWEWRYDSNGACLRRRLRGCAERHADDEGKSLKLTDGTLRGAVNMTRDIVLADVPWDANPMLAGLPGGGVLDLATCEVRPARRDEFVSRRLGVRPDPDATEPARFVALIEDMTADEETAEWLLAWLGYAITGHTSITDDATPFLIGDAGSGKSTLANLLKLLLGDYHAKLPANVLIARERSRDPHPEWKLTCLNGPRIALGTEIPERARLRAGDFKELTGGDTITANLMRMDSRTFTPSAKLMFCGNTAPSLAGWDDGLRRRIVIARCNAIPKEDRDERLPAALAEEAPAILHMLAQRARDGYASHLAGDRWLPFPSRKSEVATTSTFTEHDTVGRAISECFVFTGSEHSKTLAKDVRLTIENWYVEEGLTRGKAPSGRAIATALRRHAKHANTAIRNEPTTFGKPWFGFHVAR